MSHDSAMPSLSLPRARLAVALHGVLGIAAQLHGDDVSDFACGRDDQLMEVVDYLEQVPWKCQHFWSQNFPDPTFWMFEEMSICAYVIFCPLSKSERGILRKGQLVLKQHGDLIHVGK